MTLNTGIYQIKNTVNGDCYIGQSTNLYRRKLGHLNDLKKNIHKNQKLQRSFNKYGENCFVFNILLNCEKQELTFYEQELVNAWHPEYNIRVCVDSNIGLKRSNEVRKRKSMAMIGHKIHLGYTASFESRQRMSASHIGKHLSENNINKLKERMMGNKIMCGRKHTEETRAKMSLSQTKRRTLEGKHDSNNIIK